MIVHTAEFNSHHNAYSIGDHSHNYYEIVYYLSGNGYIKINGVKYDYSANTFSLTKPECFHKEESVGPVNLLYVGFSVDNDTDISFLQNGLYTTTKNSYILSTMREIAFELQNKSFYYKDQLNLLCNILINHIKRNITLDSQRHDDLIKIRDYIKEHCIESINAIDVAKKFNYNYDYLRKEFKKYFNISISEMIVTEQVNYATNLLRTTKLKISEISFQSGFSSTSHFISCFKKQHKITPKKYIIKDIKI